MAYSKARRLAEIVADANGNLSVEGIIVPTQSSSDNDTSAASTAFVHAHIDAVLDSAPGTLNTLNEIAAALNDDANFNTTVSNAIAAKLPLAGGTMTGAVVLGTTAAQGNQTSPALRFGPSTYRLGMYTTSEGAFIENKNGDDGINFLVKTAGQAMRIDGGTGNVGIGTNPASGVRLDMRSNAAATIGDFRNASATGFGLYVAAGDTASQYAFRAADYQNNALFSVMGDGNVGIGVTDPDKKLEIKSDTTYDGILLDVLSSPEIIFRDRGNSDTLIGTGRHGLDGFHIDTYAGNALFIQGSTREVGIGTTSPSAKLSIFDEDAGQPMLQVRNYSVGATGGFGNAHSVELRSATSTTTHGVLIHHNEATSSRRSLDVADSNGIFASFVNGNVGIGTTNPTAHLHIAAANPTIKLGAYSFITEDVEDTDSFGLWTHTSESILFGQTPDSLTNRTVTCRIDNNGILRPTRFRLPASALPTSALSAGELHMDTGDSNKVKVYNGSAWVSLNNTTLGESGDPAADGAALLSLGRANGTYYFDYDGTEYSTYYIGDVLGGGWQLAMCVTNGADSGDTVADVTNSGYTATGRDNWFNGDTTVGAGNTGVVATGTNWFTAANTNELNVSSMTALNKTNSRGRGFFKSFTNMMIRQNVGGTIGYRSYVLNANKSLYTWLQTADHGTFTNRTSSSSTAGSGVTTNNSTAIRLSNIDFNYLTSNDGGRIVTSGSVSAESSGGISCRVDGHRGYAWAGNVVNDYTARSYSLDGTIDDHTLWIFVK